MCEILSPQSLAVLKRNYKYHLTNFTTTRAITKIKTNYVICMITRTADASGVFYNITYHLFTVSCLRRPGSLAACSKVTSAQSKLNTCNCVVVHVDVATIKSSECRHTPAVQDHNYVQCLLSLEHMHFSLFLSSSLPPPPLSFTDSLYIPLSLFLQTVPCGVGRVEGWWSQILVLENYLLCFLGLTRSAGQSSLVFV